MAYIRSSKDQNWLFPPRILDFIPKDHICFLVEDFVESLDFTKFDMIYDGAGHPAYHPRILMKILAMGMLAKTRSSRKLAKASRENIIFMYLSEKVNPNFRTISDFRKNNPDFVKDAFRNTVKLASKNDLVDLSFVGIDGSTFKANAGKRRSVNKIMLDILDKAIDKMIKEDIALDELEDQLYGDKEEHLTGMDKRDMKRIVRDYVKQNKNKIKERHEKVKKEFKRDPKQKKLSLSDNDARMMSNKKGYTEMSYNAQLSVDKNQIILANDVCQDKHDANQFVQQIKNVKKNIKLRKDTKVGLDCGYSSGDNIKFAEDEGIDLYVPSRAQAQSLEGKEQTLKHDQYEYDYEKDEIIADNRRWYYKGFYRRKSEQKILMYYNDELKKKKDVPEFFRERLRMRDKMETLEGKEVYNNRKITCEPAYGNNKENFGFRDFLLRGLDKVKTELNLVCIAHNLQKIYNLRAAKGC